MVQFHDVQRQLKILCCSTAFLPAESHGGLPYSTFNLCRALGLAGADVRVVTTDRNGSVRLEVPTDRWTAYEQVPVWYARTRPGPFLYAPTTARAISEALSEADCVLNSGTLWVHSGLVSWRYARRYAKASLTYPRGLLNPRAFGAKALRKQIHWRLVGRRILQSSTVIVALTEAEREYLEVLGVRGRIEVIPNGAGFEDDAAATPGDRAWLDDRLPSLRGRRFVLYLGRIHEQKGVDVLVATVAACAHRYPDVTFVAAGPLDAAFSSRWEELLNTYGVRDRLVAPGPVAGALKRSLLSHATLFVLPSYGEAMPVAVLEALGAGCPVIISTGCNLPEVETAGAGLVVDAKAEAFGQAIASLLSNEPHRRLMASRAAALARDRFDWRTIGEHTLALCREVIAG